MTSAAETPVEVRPTAPRRVGGARLRAALLVFAVLDGLFLIGWTTFVFVWYQTALASVEAEKQKIRDRGEPVYFSDLKPAPVPAEEDGTPLLLRAIELYREPSPEFREFCEGFFGRSYEMRDDVLAQDQSPQTSEHVQTAATANAESIRLMRRAAKMPVCRFPVDFDMPSPLAASMPHMPAIRSAADILHAQAIGATARGNDKVVLDSIHGLLDLSEILRQERFIVNQLVRYTLAKKAVAALSIAAAHIDLNDQDRGTFDERLADIGSRLEIRDVIIHDRAIVITQLESQFDRCEDFFGQPGPITIKPVILDQLAFYLQWMEKFSPYADMEGPEASEFTEAMNLARQSAPKQAIVTALITPAYLAFRSASLGLRQRVANARLALRIDRHYRQTGALPEALDEVLDEALPAIPPCVFSGRQPVYRKLPRGFAIYDMGADLTDNQVRTNDVHERTTLVKVVYPAE